MRYKEARVIYSPPISKEKSGISIDVPAHVRVEWLDKDGRRNLMFLDLPPVQVEQISQLPDLIEKINIGER